MRKIIIVCQVFYPDTTSTSQLFQNLLRALATMGWGVHVLCGYPAETGLRHSHIARKEVWNGISIHRCGLRIPLKKHSIYRALSYFSFLTSIFFQLLLFSPRCIWLGVTNPPLNAHIISIVAWIRRHNFQYFFLDLYPEGLLGLGILSHSNPIVKLWLRLNRIAYHRANQVFVLGRDMVPLLTQNYKLPLGRIIYIPHWSAVEPRIPISFNDSKFVNEWGLTGKFVVQYSGNMGLWHDMDSLVRAAHLLQHDSDFQFVFIGDGIRKNAAVKLAKKMGAKNIIWKDFCSLNDLPESLATCHISLISLRKGLKGVAVPCKLYGILASGRAVVAQTPPDSEIGLTVVDNRCGIVVEPGNIPQLARTLTHLKNNPADVTAMGQQAFFAYQSKYTASSAAESLEKYLGQ